MLITNEITHKIIQFAMEIHTRLWPGLLESTYKECLFYRIAQSGLFVEKEKPISLFYDNVNLDCGYRIDLLVENQVVVEIKSTEALHDIHMAQVLTYLKLGNYKLGLLINFNVLRLKNGIRRLINGTL